MAVDDAHWGDPASLRLLEFMLPRLEDLPMLLLVAARPAEPGARSEPPVRLSADPAARDDRPGGAAAAGPAARAGARAGPGGRRAGRRLRAAPRGRPGGHRARRRRGG